MHTFQPLLGTYCHEQLSFFVCLVHFPAHESIEDLTGKQACRSLCQEVFNKCKYAVDQLKFKWPGAISCDTFPTTKDCRVSDGFSGSIIPAPGCSLVVNLPVCSPVISSGESSGQQFFTLVKTNFTNYFKHPTQDMAIYELSRHTRLINLLVAMQYHDPDKHVRICLDRIRYLLCVLHLPHCGRKEYLITKLQCEQALTYAGCVSTIRALRGKGYVVNWPPVSVNCSEFRQVLTPEEKEISQYRSEDDNFEGQSPPPPAVIPAVNGSDFIQIQWATFPPEFSAGLDVQTEILYRVSGIEADYSHHHPVNGETSTFIEGLPKNHATYDVLVGTINNQTLLPGTFSQLQLRTGEAIERVNTSFCSEFYTITGSFPNMFGDSNQTFALSHMHTFFPLYDTMCSSDLKALMCSAFLPPYISQSVKPCQSLCQAVVDRCYYAIGQLKFKWPKELSCDRLPTKSPCYKPAISSDDAIIPNNCSPTTEQSICSLVLNSTLKIQPNYYFSSVKKTFSNYFGHNTQEQAVYELSNHAGILNLLVFNLKRLKGGESFLYQATSYCIQNLTYILCTLHLPRCSIDTYNIRRSDCTEVLYNSNGRCAVAVQDLRTKGYSITWPPVQLDCNVFPFRTTYTHSFGSLTSSSDRLPPPAVVNNTLNSTTLTMELNSDYQFGDYNEYDLFYKPVNEEEGYVHVHHKKNSVFMTIDGVAEKNYEIFVGVVNPISGVPGRLEKITYVYGTNIHDIPTTLDLCYRYYQKTILPNRFGDQNVEEAKTRMTSFFPLVYTLCSDEITPFMCSLFLPRFHSRHRPCRSVCQRIYKSCSYAIQQISFNWISCDTFETGNSCYDITELFLPDGKVPLPNPARDLRPQRAIQECAEVNPNLICSGVFLEDHPTPYFNTLINFNAGSTNYFNHTSKDEAVYELSKYLTLLSLLAWDTEDRNFQGCANNLIILLCHLHVPVCPVNPRSVTQTDCRRIFNVSSSCHVAITKLQTQRMDIKWPPVNVNCLDAKWFGEASNEESYTGSDLLFQRLPPPPPAIIGVSYRDSTQITIRYTSPVYNDGLTFSTGVLYRQQDTVTEYTVKNAPPFNNRFLLGELEPGTNYEIKLASLYSFNGLPGLLVTVTNRTYGSCPTEITGDTASQGEFIWGSQLHGRSRSLNCSYGYGEGYEVETFRSDEPTRHCLCNDIACNWLDPQNTEYCKYKTFNNDTVTQELSNLLQTVKRHPETAVNISKRLVNLTSNITAFQGEDVTLTVIILENLVDNEQYLNETGPNIVQTINNILNIADGILISNQKISKTSSRTLRILERYLDNVAIIMGGNVTQNEANIAVFSQDINAKDFLGAGAASLIQQGSIEPLDDDFVVYNDDGSVQTQASQVSLTLPKSLFESLGIESRSKNQRVSFVIYRRTSLFQSARKNSSTNYPETVRGKNSYVISGAVRGHVLKNLTNPIVSTYYPLRNAVQQSPACVFWEFKMDNGLGGWSRVGCTYQGTAVDGLVTCHCDHLTNFAILMDIYIDDENSAAHDKALSIISYVGCAVSLLGLILTIITILIFKDLRSKGPTQILLNFCISLALTLVVFLAAAERSKTSSMAACRAAAIALHYFVLATFVWMAISAFNMYQAFVKVIPKHRSRFLLKCCLVGWGLPAIVVIITAAVAIDEYGDDNFCRVKGLPFQLAFLTPVLVILVANSVAFSLILYSLLTSRRNISADRKISGLTQARRGAAILVVLGLTWLFGILAVKEAKLLFQYLFCIFNSIQGLLVFIFYCLLSTETRKKYRKLLCGKSRGKDSESGQKVHGSSAADSRFHAVNSKMPNESTSATRVSSGVPSRVSSGVAGGYPSNPAIGGAIEIHIELQPK